MRAALATLVALAAAVLPAAAHADTTFSVTLTGQTTPALTFTIPTGGTAAIPMLNEFLGFTSAVQLGNMSFNSNIVFYGNVAGNEFALTGATAPGATYSIPDSFISTSPFWTGTLQNPTFLAGSYSGNLYNGLIQSSGIGGDTELWDGLPLGQDPGVLTITTPQATTPTPEPSSLLLLATAALGAFAALKRRSIFG